MQKAVARAHRRYALHLPVELCSAGPSDGETKANGLLIEISCENARISQLERDGYRIGDTVTVQSACGMNRQARIRWTRANNAGVRFEQALHLNELTDLLSTRGPDFSSVGLRYAAG